MKDNLERYIIENRESFNDAEPNPFLWLEIEKKIPTKEPAKIISFVKYFAVAASVVILLGLGVLIGLNVNSNDDNSLLASNEIYREYQEAEHYFQKEVSNKMNQLQGHEMEEDVQDDLNQLDAVYNEMKVELMNSTQKDNSVIINAMIDNYRIKIDMLEKILLNLNDKKTQNETNLSI